MYMYIQTHILGYELHVAGIYPKLFTIVPEGGVFRHFYIFLCVSYIAIGV